MAQIMVAFEVVSPVFLIIFVGYFLKTKGIINESFIQMAMKVIFTICLPGLLFLKVSQADVKTILSGDSLKFTVFVVLTTLLVFFIAKVFASKFVEHKSQGAFVQGAFRSNYIIIGYSVLYSMFGDLIISRMALLVIVIVPLYNVLAIWVLSEDVDKSWQENVKAVFKKIVTNPLIIGIVLGFLVALLKLNIPVILESTLSKLGATGTPLGLIGIGGYLTLDGLKSNRMTYISVFIKIVLSPLIVVILAILLGYGYMDITILFVLFGSPTAISSFIMATALGGDGKLAANVVIISTGFSLLTFIVGLTLLSTFIGV